MNITRILCHETIHDNLKKINFICSKITSFARKENKNEKNVLNKQRNEGEKCFILCNNWCNLSNLYFFLFFFLSLFTHSLCCIYLLVLVLCFVHEKTKVSLIYDAVFVFAIGLQTLQHSSKIVLSNVNVSCKNEQALHLGSSLINFINTVCIL